MYILFDAIPAVAVSGLKLFSEKCKGFPLFWYQKQPKYIITTK